MTCETALSIDINGKIIDAMVTKPLKHDIAWSKKFCVLLTHGAGGDMNAPQLVTITNHLVKHGFLVLRFTCKPPNFKYRVKIYSAIIKYVQKEYSDLIGCIIAGRSMGGRVAAEVASNHLNEYNGFITGVASFSYPLHKAKEYKDLRISHLINLTLPTFFASGKCDLMCKQDLFEDVINKMKCSVTMHWIENADHSLKVADDKMDELCSEFVNWCNSVFVQHT